MKSLLDQVIHSYENNTNLSKEQLLEVVKKLQPRKTTKKIGGFDWVALAAAKKNDVSTFLRHVYAEDGFLIATDGHRMHVSKTELENGFYCPKTSLKVECSDKFPRWRRVMPSNTEVFDMEFIEVSALKKESFHRVDTNHGICFNENYLREMHRNKAPVSCYRLPETKHTMITYFEDESFCVLMPMSMPKVK